MLLKRLEPEVLTVALPATPCEVCCQVKSHSFLEELGISWLYQRRGLIRVFEVHSWCRAFHCSWNWLSSEMNGCLSSLTQETCWLWPDCAPCLEHCKSELSSWLEWGLWFYRADMFFPWMSMNTLMDTSACSFWNKVRPPLVVIYWKYVTVPKLL